MSRRKIASAAPAEGPADSGFAQHFDAVIASRLGTAVSVGLFLLALVIGAVVSLRWTLNNPHIAGWDQIQYVDIALKDALTRKLEGAGALRDALFNDYRWMPPGIRFISLPLTALHVETETQFRLFSLVVFVLSLLLAFDAARRISTVAIAAGVTTLVAVAPVWVRASEDFMSETAMIPATVLALWCLVRESEPLSRRSWVIPPLMGAALGFGMLARFSAAPMTAILFLMLFADALRHRTWTRLLIAIVVATLIAWPSYAYNGVRYIAYGRFAATWPLDQMPGHGLVYAARYIRQLAASIFGYTLLVVPFAIAFAAIALARPERLRAQAPGIATADIEQRRFIGVGCGLILVAMLIPHVFGHNQNPRYLLGALPVLSLFLASGLGIRMALLTGSVAAVQALVMLGVMLAGPSKQAMAAAIDRTDLTAVSWRPDPVCDFSQAVRAVAPHAARPLVKFYGVTGLINHVQIELAFLRAGILPDVIPADLSKPDLTDPTKVGADIVLVLRDAGENWHHSFVADPNARVNAVRAELLADPNFIKSDAQIGGPEQCRMDVFLPRR